MDFLRPPPTPRPEREPMELLLPPQINNANNNNLEIPGEANLMPPRNFLIPPLRDNLAPHLPARNLNINLAAPPMPVADEPVLNPEIV